MKKNRILIVDDNEINQFITLKMLQKMGFCADVAGNGFEAFMALRKASYDLVLMDCQMPICDGYEATKLIRNFEDTKNTVIIAFTSNDMTGEAEKCLAEGMNAYLSKPASHHVLEKTIHFWLAKKAS